MAQELPETVRSCSVLLLDIEGTTTSISFVKDKLFPYAEANVKQFLEKEWESDDVKSAVEALRSLAIEDQKKELDGFVTIPGGDASKEDQIEGLVNNVKWQMSSDRKAGALKQIQGLIWKQGYDSGSIKGHVYEDVPDALKQWRSSGDNRKVYIYSSGSVQAQKLLFGQSDFGDLLCHIDGHFDTEVGAKQEAESYKKIVEKIGVDADKILFLTDIVKEAEAAVGAGLKAILVSRSEEAPQETKLPIIKSMAELHSTKRKLEDEVEEAAQPAKVAKTESEGDVKSNGAAAVEKNGDADVEKMEAESVEDKPAEKEDAKAAEEITIEELPAAAADEPSAVPEVEITPVVTEAEETTADGDKESPKAAEEGAPVEEVPLIVEEESTTKDVEMKEDAGKAEETAAAKEEIVVEEVTEEKAKEVVEDKKEEAEKEKVVEKVESNGNAKPEVNGSDSTEKLNGDATDAIKNGDKKEAADATTEIAKNGTVENGKNGTADEDGTKAKEADIKVKTVEEKVEADAAEAIATA